jgi:hypothetical protein
MCRDDRLRHPCARMCIQDDGPWEEAEDVRGDVGTYARSRLCRHFLFVPASNSPIQRHRPDAVVTTALSTPSTAGCIIRTGRWRHARNYSRGRQSSR